MKVKEGFLFFEFCIERCSFAGVIWTFGVLSKFVNDTCSRKDETTLLKHFTNIIIGSVYVMHLICKNEKLREILSYERM